MTYPSLRTVLSLLLATAVLAACAPVGASPTPTPAPVTIRFAYRTNAAYYVTLADEFHEKYPNITVQLLPGGGLQQMVGDKLSLTQLKMQAVDAFRDTLPYAPGADLASQLLPLDEYITKYKGFPASDFLPGLLEAMKVGSAQIGIPAGINPLVAYYDSRRVKDAGATVPTPDWTLDDFVAVASATNNQKPADASDPRYVIGFCSDPLSADPVVFTYLMGGQLVDNLQSPTRPMMDSAANQRALEWYANLHTQLKVTPDVGVYGPDSSRYGSYRAIANGRCGVWLGFYGDMGGKSWGTLWLGDPVMMPLPRGQASFNAAAVDGYFILRYASHPDEAWLWLSFLLDHAEAAGIEIPPRRSQIEADTFIQSVTPDVAVVARNMSGSTTMIVNMGSPQSVSSLINVYLQAAAQVVNGEADAQTALAAAQQKALLMFAK